MASYFLGLEMTMISRDPDMLYQRYDQYLKQDPPGYALAVQTLEDAIVLLPADDARRPLFDLQLTRAKDGQTKRADRERTNLDAYLTATPAQIDQAQKCLEVLRIIDPDWPSMAIAENRLRAAVQQREATEVVANLRREVDELLQKSLTFPDGRTDARNRVDGERITHQDNPFLEEPLDNLAKEVFEREQVIAKIHAILTTRAQTGEWQLVEKALDEAEALGQLFLPVYELKTEERFGMMIKRPIEKGTASAVRARVQFEDNVQEWAEDLIRSKMRDALVKLPAKPQEAKAILESLSEYPKGKISDETLREFRVAVQRVDEAVDRRLNLSKRLQVATAGRDGLTAWDDYVAAREVDPSAEELLEQARTVLVPKVKEDVTRRSVAWRRDLQGAARDVDEIRSEAEKARQILGDESAFGESIMLVDAVTEDCVFRRQANKRLAEINLLTTPEDAWQELSAEKERLGARAVEFPDLARVEARVLGRMGLARYKQSVRDQIQHSIDITALEDAITQCTGQIERTPSDSDLPLLRQRIRARLSFVKAEALFRYPERRLEAEPLYRDVINLNGDDQLTATGRLDTLTPDLKAAQQAGSAVISARGLALPADRRPDKAAAGRLDQALRILGGLVPLPDVVSADREIRSLWEQQALTCLQELEHAEPLASDVESYVYVLRLVGSSRAAEWAEKVLAPACVREAERLNSAPDRLEWYQRAYDESGRHSEYVRSWYEAGEAVALSLIAGGLATDVNQLGIADKRLLELIPYLATRSQVLLALAKACFRSANYEKARKHYQEANDQAGIGKDRSEFEADMQTFNAQLRFAEVKSRIVRAIPSSSTDATYIALADLRRLRQDALKDFPGQSKELLEWFEEQIQALKASLLSRLQNLRLATGLRLERWEVARLLVTIAPDDPEVIREWASIGKAHATLEGGIATALARKAGPAVGLGSDPQPLASVNAQITELEQFERELDLIDFFTDEYNRAHAAHLTRHDQLAEAQNPNGDVSASLKGVLGKLSRFRDLIEQVVADVENAKGAEVTQSRHAGGTTYGPAWDAVSEAESKLLLDPDFREHNSLRALKDRVKIVRDRREDLQRVRVRLVGAMKFDTDQDFAMAKASLETLQQAHQDGYNLLIGLVLEDPWLGREYRGFQINELKTEIDAKEVEYRLLTRWAGLAEKHCWQWWPCVQLLSNTTSSRVRDWLHRLALSVNAAKTSKEQGANQIPDPSWPKELAEASKLGAIEEARRTASWSAVSQACISWIGLEPGDVGFSAQGVATVDERVQLSVHAVQGWGEEWSLRQVQAFLGAPPVSAEAEDASHTLLRSRASWNVIRSAAGFRRNVRLLLEVVEYYWWMSTDREDRSKSQEWQEMPKKNVLLANDPTPWPVLHDTRWASLNAAVGEWDRERKPTRKDNKYRTAVERYRELVEVAPSWAGLGPIAGQLELSRSGS